jgi:hypothetical protein
MCRDQHHTLEGRVLVGDDGCVHGTCEIKIRLLCKEYVLYKRKGKIAYCPRAVQRTIVLLV